MASAGNNRATVIQPRPAVFGRCRKIVFSGAQIDSRTGL
jgi:hypothetical protein